MIEVIVDEAVDEAFNLINYDYNNYNSYHPIEISSS